jgi:hypothetical protein
VNARVGITIEATAVDACVDAVQRAIGTVFAALRVMAETMEAAWRAGAGPFTADDITGFQPAIFEQLDAQRTFDSAGYVMSEFALSGTRRHLEWWHRAEPDGRRAPSRSFQPLILNVEPGTADCYDYYSMEWFFAALSQQRRFISGPHIDLPCADVCIMTFSDPVVVDGPDGERPDLDRVVLGVAAADVAVARFESMILPPLRRLPAAAVLVNSERRVVTSNDASWITGEKLPAVPVVGDEWQAVRPVPGEVGWTLAVHR